MEAKEEIIEEKASTKAVASDQASVAPSTEPGTPPKQHKRLGMVLKNRYRIESLIASGGMSDVYKAVDLRLEKAGAKPPLVALKILRDTLTQDANALGLLAREAAKSKRLTHPRIIRVHDLDHDGDTWFMVMELLDGEPLSRVIQRAKPSGLKWRGGRAVLEQVASALAYAHRRGIVHADLKPSNIFFTRDGEIKLLDFGVSQALNPHQQVDFLNPRGEDETSVYGYTPAYASPAVIEGRDPSVEDDLFALACISYELLSSRHPFDRQKLSSEELAAFKLKKPANMPIPLWLTVRRTLKGEGSKPSLQTFQNSMKPIPWERYLYPAGMAVTATLAFTFWYLGYSEQEAIKAQLDSFQDREEQVSEIAQRSPARILDALDELQPLEKAGILKLQQSKIVAYLSQRIDENLQSPERPNLPNIPAALAILAEAQALYPHDQQLILKGEQLRRRQLPLQVALAEELVGRLEQGDYRDYVSLNELSELKEDLDFLSGKPLTPSKAATSVYNNQLKAALNNDDGAALARLLAVADLFFTETPALEARLAEARRLEDAIHTLGNYHKAVAEGGDIAPVYPTAAAEQFYESRFKRWRETIANAQNSKELDAVYEDLMEQQKQIPAGFAPLENIRQQLADAYVKEADNFLNRNRARQAQPLLQKATLLMRKSGDA